MGRRRKPSASHCRCCSCVRLHCLCGNALLLPPLWRRTSCRWRLPRKPQDRCLPCGHLQRLGSVGCDCACLCVCCIGARIVGCCLGPLEDSRLWAQGHCGSVHCHWPPSRG
eukprot:Amastigsp_a841962_469.p3 type:complete len:111 gc:universal Amastigsp_a841962_469:1243-911(-)